MNINLNQLRCFYFVAKFKSIKEAATTLFVTPPAVTMQLKKLEEWLGMKLIRRTGNSLEVTNDGEKIFVYAERIFKEVEELENELKQQEKLKRTEISIGSHYIPAKYIVPKLVQYIKGIRPKLETKVILDTIPVLVDKVKNHGLDLVLSATAPSCPKLKSMPLFKEDLVLVALHNTKHLQEDKIHIQELKNIPLLMTEETTSIYHLTYDYLHKNGITPCIAMANISADIIKSFIFQDIGLAFLLRFTVENKLARGEFREIEIVGKSPRANINLIYMAENPSPDVQAIASAVKQEKFTREDFI